MQVCHVKVSPTVYFLLTYNSNYMDACGTEHENVIMKNYTMFSRDDLTVSSKII